MRKKILYGALCVALSAMLIGCGNSDDKTTEAKDNEINTETVSSEEAVSTKEEAETTEAAKSDVEFKDVSAMSYDDAAAYLEALPESPASDFTIVEFGSSRHTDKFLSEGECLIGEYTGTDSIVIVPEEINGYKVVGVAGLAFALNDTMTAVKLPATTKVIQSHAFAPCSKLSVITGIDNVETLGEACFSTGSTLRIKFTDSVTSAPESPLVLYSGYGEVYVKKDSYLAGEKFFGGYEETNENSAFQIIFY